MTGTPTVLFVCVHNAGRSQMAAGWLSHLAGDRIEVRSAGSQPSGRTTYRRTSRKIVQSNGRLRPTARSEMRQVKSRRSACVLFRLTRMLTAPAAVAG